MVTCHIHWNRPDLQCNLSTSYSLFATATYHIETLSPVSSPSASSLTSTFCNLMQTCNPLSGWLSHADKKSHADRVDIEIVRHLVSPPSTRHASNTSIFPPTTFSISAQAKESSPIPNDVVSRLSLVASIPGFVSTTETSIPISLKARFKDSDNNNNEEASDKLAIERVEIDIDQNDTFYAKPDDQYTSRFALPSEQPPTHPLLHRSVSDSLEHLGFIVNENRPKKWTKSKSVLDPLAPSSFFLDAQEGETPVEGEDKPYTLSADWSIIKMEAALRNGKDGVAIPATHISPFLRVTHTLNIALYIKYGNDKKDVVQFPLPINFVALPPTTTTTSTPTPVQSITTTTSRSYEPLYLPAYTQLFHEDGEARVDLSRGVPPAYRDNVGDGEGQEDGVVETFGRTVKKPELVPVGTTEVDWNSVQRLLD